MKAVDRFLSTFSLISRIPVKVKFNFDPSRMDFYLPIAGIVPALLVFSTRVVLSVAGNIPANHPLIAAVLVTGVQYLCFNLFHLDGLMDTADAFLGSVSREKRLEILKDSRVGVYGFFAGFMNLVLKIALLSALLPLVREYAALVLAYPISGRYAAALVPTLSPPAGPGGLGALAKESAPGRAVAGAVIAFLVWGAAAFAVLVLGSAYRPALLFGGGLLALVSLLVIGPLTAWFYAKLYRKGIGGYTGDALGAAVETAELLHLAGTALLLLILPSLL